MFIHVICIYCVIVNVLVLFGRVHSYTSCLLPAFCVYCPLSKHSVTKMMCLCRLKWCNVKDVFLIACLHNTEITLSEMMSCLNHTNWDVRFVVFFVAWFKIGFGFIFFWCRICLRASYRSIDKEENCISLWFVHVYAGICCVLQNSCINFFKVSCHHHHLCSSIQNALLATESSGVNLVWKLGGRGSGRKNSIFRAISPK